MAAAEFLVDLSVIESWASLILFPRVLVVALFLRPYRKDTSSRETLTNNTAETPARGRRVYALSRVGAKRR